MIFNSEIRMHQKPFCLGLLAGWLSVMSAIGCFRPNIPPYQAVSSALTRSNSTEGM